MLSQWLIPDYDPPINLTIRPEYYNELSPVHNGCTTACDTTVVRLDTIVYHGAATVAAVAQPSWSQSQEFGLVKLLRRDCNSLQLFATTCDRRLQCAPCRKSLYDGVDVLNR